jgi:hypothetical protein
MMRFRRHLDEGEDSEFLSILPSKNINLRVEKLKAGDGEGVGGAGVV